jgi:hypothetical protein
MGRLLTILAAGAISCGLLETAAAQTFVPGSGPAWYGSLGTILLNRENPEYDVIARGAIAQTTPVYTTSGADFDADFGYDLTFGRRFTGDWGVEARYFNVKMDTTLPTILTNLGAVTAFNNNDPLSGLGIGGNVFAGGTYASRLQSVEFNARRQATENVGILYGFRYLELAEELSLQYELAPGQGLQLIDRQHIGGRNEMFGGQLGLDALLLLRDWFSVTSFGKAGLYYNAAHARAGDQFGNPLPFSTRQSAGQDDEAAFVTETGIKLNVQLTSRLSWQTGYNVLYLGGVALASDQIAVSDPDLRSTIVGVQGPIVNSAVDTSHLWLHGMTMSLAWAWSGLIGRLI